MAGQPQAVTALGDALLRETDPRVREAILTALARIGTDESAAAILPLIRSDDAGLRTGAIDALRLMPRALAARLQRLLVDPDPDVRLLASDLARELPALEATRLLCNLLADEPEANVSAAAVDVLAECGTLEALPVLAATSQRFAEVPFLAFACKIAADRIRANTSASDG
jgi:HEAT repeat protein